ncbi:PQQ-dependent sugar dehydrogenase [Planococcus shenhongbingii]|uniref:PQQ-dependent sugar dehydrogenase n=1 Tax=Planococcus shenhongbingii TaxID=3058398 RepID=UPI00261660FF|nr:PQQ-dependent sugar dehydrogenase [Planococcus sp. N016]WKA57178.1 PQQ-dependent sugar dehydrogenase [Planococcus sp. N016]
MKKFLFPLLSLVVLAGCNDAPANPKEATVATEAIASGLDIPWSINKINDEFYISERPGTVAHVAADGKVTHQQVEFSDPLSSAAEAGFLGFVLAHDFEESKQAYGYYVYERNGRSFNKIARFQQDGGAWQETDVLLEGIPTGNVHHGGRLELDKDGVLFATVGDASEPELAQDLASVNGKILRLNEFDEFEIYSHGHRNPQGIAWAEDTMYASEHGQSANDEINIIEEGNNYGWPTIEGNASKEGMESPYYTTGSDETWAPSGIAIHDGMLYVAALRGTAVKVIDLETGDVADSYEGFGRVRDVFSDGEDLYFVTNNTDGRGTPNENDDQLYRLSKE